MAEYLASIFGTEKDKYVHGRKYITCDVSSTLVPSGGLFV